MIINQTHTKLRCTDCGVIIKVKPKQDILAIKCKCSTKEVEPKETNALKKILKGKSDANPRANTKTD